MRRGIIPGNAESGGAMELDHLAIVAADLEAGAGWLEERLGLPLSPGGRHALFGTWNRLLSLGPGLYLEVIAPDPAAAPPGRPRWFGLDHVAAPRLGNWIARVGRPEEIPGWAGQRLALSRGDLAWEIAVPADGSLPEGGGLPSVIAWRGGAHPSTRLPDSGARLVSLTIRHPRAETLARPVADGRLRYEVAAVPSLSAVIATPAGERGI